MSLPEWMGANRAVVRVPKNPMDVSTIISAYPKQIKQVNHTITPGEFIIPAAKSGDIEVLTVGTSSWFKELEEDQPLIEIIVPSVEVARSVIDDYCVGLLGCDNVNAKPALLWIPGEFTKAEVLKVHSGLIAQAREKQKNWFLNLVSLADALWVRTNGQPQSISDDMRMAARELNLIDKGWLKNQQASELTRCLACGTLVASSVIVCPNCKVILDEAKFKALGLSFAK